MAIYTIADLHLSLSANKPMDIFPGWKNYVSRIEKNFTELLKEEDSLILAGDFSWGIDLEESLEDFKFLDKFKGKKYLLKGNHDYFWDTLTKMNRFFEENDINSISILHNNAYEIEGFAICGTRGWVNDTNNNINDKKIIKREAGRLERSILGAKKFGKPLRCFLHYPPVYKNAVSQDILNLLYKYNIEKCYYGHIHGDGQKHAVEGNYNGVNLQLVSADSLDFLPVKVE